MRDLWDLFLAFFKVGGLTFGGGYAMLPILQREVADKRGWVTDEEIMDYYAVAQCLPGLIAVNTAILTGNKVKKKLGGVFAALGVVAPSLIIIMVIAAFLQNFLEYEVVQKAFWGVRVVVSALIVEAIIKMWKASMKNMFSYILFGAALLLALFTKVPTALIVVMAVAVGIGYGVFSANNAHKKKGGADA